MHSPLRILLTGVFTLAVILALPAAALADGVVYFTGSTTNQSNITASLGGITSSTGEVITSVGSTLISNGIFTFTTLDASSSFTFPDGFDNTYAAGGTFELTGQIFGLPAGTILLSGNLGSGQTIHEDAGTTAYYGNDNSRITYVNPTLFSDIRANYYGGPVDIVVEQGFSAFPDLSIVQTNTVIAATPVPESPTLLLLGLGIATITAVSAFEASRARIDPVPARKNATRRG